MPGAYRRICQIAYVSLLLLVPLLVSVAWGDSFTDDAYISFGYAQNLARGQRLVENVWAGQQTPPLIRSPLYLLTAGSAC